VERDTGRLVVHIIHRFIGGHGALQWEGVTKQAYESPEAQGVTVQWLIGPSEKAPHFAVRYLEVQPGSATSLDRHEHDHGVVILKGRGQVRLADEITEVSFGDVIYVPPNELHQFTCAGEEPLGFLCVIPARRGRGQ
jgi:quercetin dioxygenase-like cupin family protein